MSALAVAVVDDPFLDEHRALEAHPERPERLAAARRAAQSVAARTSRLHVPTRRATDAELARVHTERYLEHLGRAAGSRGHFDEDTYSAPQSVEVARRAAGGAVELVDALVDRRALRGVALLRPPGHHARPDAAMGFCLLNNVAVAAAHARARGIARVLVLDFDVHHGNGTQEIFYRDPSVLFVSLHQSPFYPGSGAADETGGGDGRGYTLNVPLGAHASDATYLAAFERIVTPVASEFAPELVLLSAGFDAHRDDPLGQMDVTEEGYRAMVEALLGAVPYETPIAALLEGGYDLAALEASLRASLEALVGLPPEAREIAEKSDVPPSPPGRTTNPTATTVSQRHTEELARSRLAAAEFWSLG
jgi:acetoin utilization deacetylase AcuC-like enzyme